MKIRLLAMAIVLLMVSCDERDIAPTPVPEPENPNDQIEVVSQPSDEAKISIPANEFKAVFNEMVEKGYEPIYIDGFLHISGIATDIQTGTYFNIIYRKKIGSQGMKCYFGLTEDGMKNKIIELTQDGYDLTFLESYPQSGNIRFAAIFKTGVSTDFHPEFNVPLDSWQAKFDLMVNAGYRLVTRSIVWDNGERYVSALFDNKNVGGWIAKSLLTPAEMQTFMEGQDDLGKSVSNFDVIQETPTKYKFGAVFNSEPVSKWYALNGLSKAQLLSEIASAKGKGYLLQTIDAYDKYEPINGNEYYVTYYIASWRKK